MARKIGSRYSIDRIIGRGTCGTVWLGTGPAGPVAVKLLREDLAADQTLIARFVQERTVLTSLVHPNIVAVRDLVVDGTDLALIMDLVEGDDLRGHLERERALRPAEAAALVADVAAALAAAHTRGVVHRDVKPENVLLDHTAPGGGAGGPGGRRARLTDFGIARLVDGPRRTRATRIVGTPDYLAPEVIEGCPPGPPVDLYALGTVLFELLTGWTPFGGGHPGAVLRRHVTEAAPEVPGMPPALADLLGSCLSKAPAARLTAAELALRLRELAPDLAGLPALRAADPRAGSAAGRGPADPALGRPMQVGALPLVRAMIEDESKQTHVNLIRPIKDPLGPSAPVPRSGGSRDAASDAGPGGGAASGPGSGRRFGFAGAGGVGAGAAGGSSASSSSGGFGGSGGSGGFGGAGAPAGTGADGSSSSAAAARSLAGTETGLGSADPSSSDFAAVPRQSGPSALSNRIAAFAAVLAAGLVAAGGTVWWQSGHGAATTPSPGASSAGAAAAGSPLDGTAPGTGSAPASPTAPAVRPVGPLDLVPLAAAPAPPAAPVGAVAYAAAGPKTAVLAATGTDGVVRVAVAAPGRPFTSWLALPGLGSDAAPSLVGRADGRVEIFAVSSESDEVERAVYLAGSWSEWSRVAAPGVPGDSGEQFTGNPAAIGRPDGNTLLLATSKSGELRSAVATEAADGSAVWQDWQTVSAAGSVKPGLALAGRADGSMAAFVTRAKDEAVLRVSYDVQWAPAWPTGAVGLPAAGYAADGRPYLFVQEITGDVQVFEPSGADLHGTMNWVTAGVTTKNPPGVGDDGSAVTLTTVGPDGAVEVYTTAR